MGDKDTKSHETSSFPSSSAKRENEGRENVTELLSDSGGGEVRYSIQSKETTKRMRRRRTEARKTTELKTRI